MRFVVTALILSFSVYFAAGDQTSISISAADKVRLFSVVTQPRAMAEKDKSSIASVREAEIAITPDAATLARQPAILIQLFDGNVREATSVTIELRSATDVTWTGKIAYGAVDGDVIITHRGGFVSGLIYGPTSAYEIVPRGEKHILVELDQSLFPDCAGAVATNHEATKPRTTLDPSVGVDSGDRIDVMVVYTTAVKNFLGGDAQAQALAQSAIDEANAAYLNSKIRQRVRMVHTQEFVYTETTDSGIDLFNLRDSQIIQTLRETHKADLVVMLNESADVCGIGFLMDAPGGTPSYGFSITTRACAIGNLVFAHELGHNMGSDHNPENAAGTTIFPFGYGHYVNGNYRTVMSYTNPCPDGCMRRPYFSNPSVSFNGLPTGIEGARDNARMINATADWIANYGYSGTSITMTNFTAAGDWLPLRIRRNVTWTSDNLGGNVKIELSRDDGTTWETLVVSTANDGSEAISVGGRATRRGRIRVTSLANPTVSDSSVTNVSIR